MAAVSVDSNRAATTDDLLTTTSTTGTGQKVFDIDNSATAKWWADPYLWAAVTATAGALLILKGVRRG